MRIPAGRYLLFFGVLTVGCFLDLYTKRLMFQSYHDPTGLAPPEQHWWIDGWLGIETSVNQGALFGMGQGHSGWFALLSVVAMIGIGIWLFVFRAAVDRWLTLSLGAVCGGILGNLYDRLGLWHGGSSTTFQGVELPANQLYGVRDWIHFRWEGAPLAILDPWPNFNIADMLLVCGAAALFLHAVFARHPAEPSCSRDAAPDADNQPANKEGAISTSAETTRSSASSRPKSRKRSKRASA